MDLMNLREEDLKRILHINERLSDIKDIDILLEKIVFVCPRCSQYLWRNVNKNRVTPPAQCDRHCPGPEHHHPHRPGAQA